MREHVARVHDQCVGFGHYRQPTAIAVRQLAGASLCTSAGVIGQAELWNARSHELTFSCIPCRIVAVAFVLWAASPSNCHEVQHERDSKSDHPSTESPWRR